MNTRTHMQVECNWRLKYLLTRERGGKWLMRGKNSLPRAHWIWIISDRYNSTQLDSSEASAMKRTRLDSLVNEKRARIVRSLIHSFFSSLSSSRLENIISYASKLHLCDTSDKSREECEIKYLHGLVQWWRGNFCHVGKQMHSINSFFVGSVTPMDTVSKWKSDTQLHCAMKYFALEERGKE